MTQHLIIFFCLFTCAITTSMAQPTRSPIHFTARELDSTSVIKLLNSNAFKTYTPAEVYEVQLQSQRYNRLISDSLRQLETKGMAFDSTGISPAFKAVLQQEYTYKEVQYHIKRGENAKAAIAQRILGLAYGYPYLYKTTSNDPRQYYDISRTLDEVWVYPLQHADTFFVVAVLLRLTPKQSRKVSSSDVEKTLHQHTLIDANRLEIASNIKKNPRDMSPFSGGYGGVGGGSSSGSSGSGPNIGSGLAGRTLKVRPTFQGVTANGKVMVKICINEDGNVTSAICDSTNSTIIDADTIKKCIENARKYKFSSSEQPTQCGTLTFNFKDK
jgi:hypothetical protein